MAIAPIDLQTLFTQIDKVGKSQTAQREGQVMHQAIQGTELQKKTEEQIRQVNETQDTGEGVENINDRTHKQKDEGKGGSGKKSGSEDEPEDESPQQVIVLRDPSLGNKIDISY